MGPPTMNMPYMPVCAGSPLKRTDNNYLDSLKKLRVIFKNVKVTSNVRQRI